MRDGHSTNSEQHCHFMQDGQVAEKSGQHRRHICKEGPGQQSGSRRTVVGRRGRGAGRMMCSAPGRTGATWQALCTQAEQHGATPLRHVPCVGHLLGQAAEASCSSIVHHVSCIMITY